MDNVKSNTVFLSSKLFVTGVLLSSLLRELPLPTSLLWTSIGLSPVLHNDSVVSWTLVALEVGLLVGLWTRLDWRVVWGMAGCVAGTGLTVAGVFAVLSYTSSCAVLPPFIRPEVVMSQKILFTAALAVSAWEIRRTRTPEA